MRRPLAAALATGLVLAGCTDDEAPQAPPPDAVRVAVTADDEGRLLGHVVVALVEQAGLPATPVRFADARDARQGLELGAVDAQVGYTGEAWLDGLGRADPPGDPEASFGPVRADDARRGVVWLPPRFDGGVAGPLDVPPADATFAFVVRGPPGRDADLRTVSQLATRLGERPDAIVCVDREFGTREDGLRAVLDAYRVRTDRPFLAADPAEAVASVAAGECIAGLTTATDGAAWGSGLRPLVDDLAVFPAFVPAVQVREAVTDGRPAVRRALAPFGELTTALLGGWNARIRAGEPVEDVAAEAAATLRDRAAARAEAEEREAEVGDGGDGGDGDPGGAAPGETTSAPGATANATAG